MKIKYPVMGEGQSECHTVLPAFIFSSREPGFIHAHKEQPQHLPGQVAKPDTKQFVPAFSLLAQQALYPPTVLSTQIGLIWGLFNLWRSTGSTRTLLYVCTKRKRVSGTAPEPIPFLFSREKPQALLFCFARGLADSSVQMSTTFVSSALIPAAAAQQSETIQKDDTQMITAGKDSAPGSEGALQVQQKQILPQHRGVQTGALI